MLVMIKAILHERTVTLCASMDFGFPKSSQWWCSMHRISERCTFIFCTVDFYCITHDMQGH